MSRIREIWTAFLIVCFVASLSPAAETIYEPFNYPAGVLNGTQTNGIGMATNSWTTSPATVGDRIYDMVGGALSFTDLPTQGSVRAKRPSAPGGAEMNRPISAASQSELTADNTVIWFSVLVRDERYSFGNEIGTFALASAPFDPSTTDRILPTITGGEAFGVHINGNNSRIHAFQVDGGTAASSSTWTNLLASTTTWLLAGKIEWKPNGQSDILRTFNITNAAAPEPDDSEAFAVMTADLDQSQLDTLSIANRQVSSLDEIRFGLTYYHVMGREPPPPSGTVLVIR